MNRDILGNNDNRREKRYYRGTRVDLKPGDLIEPSNSQDVGEGNRMTAYVYLTPNLDEAIWEAEIATGEASSRVYIVEPIGQIGNVSDLKDQKSPSHSSMSCYSREPLRVMGEITDWQGHAPEALKAMKDGLERLKRLGVEPIDD